MKKRTRQNKVSSNPLSPKQKEVRAAYHEAGHAVLCCLLRQPFSVASIEREGKTLGRVTIDIIGYETKGDFVKDTDGVFTIRKRGGLTERRVEKLTLVFSAGPVAEALFQGVHLATEHGWAYDRDDATAFALELFENRVAAEEYVDAVSERTQTIIAHPAVFSAVDAVAGELLNEKKLSSRTIRKIIKEEIGTDFSFKHLLEHKKIKPQ